MLHKQKNRGENKRTKRKQEQEQNENKAEVWVEEGGWFWKEGEGIGTSREGFGGYIHATIHFYAPKYTAASPF